MNDSAMTVAAFSGEIDFTARDSFRSQLGALADADVAIVDLSDVTYMDSSALAEVLFLHRARSRSGRSAPRLVIGPKITRLFDVAGMRGVVPSYASLDEAKGHGQG